MHTMHEQVLFVKKNDGLLGLLGGLLNDTEDPRHGTCTRA